MLTPEPGQPPEAGGGGWIVLGVLNEILLKLANQPDLRSLWEEVCASARWIVPSQRLCVVLANDGGGARIAARYQRGTFEYGAPEGGGVVVDAWMVAALEAQRPAWFRGPWDEAREADRARAWLLADDPDVVFHVPIQVYKKTIGTMLFALEDQRQIDRKALASATTYALYVGATYTTLKNSLDLAAASAQLREQNDELERVQIELRLQLDRVRAAHEAMLEMSTPIIQVWDGVLTLPVIGTIDSARAARMMEEVLDAVVRHGARFMIVDLTGAQAADTSTIDHLLRIFAATRLLGSQCIVSGVPTAMVGRILESGGSLDGIPVFSTLKSALEHAVGALRQQAQPARR
ncbi:MULTISPECIES: STAS domain-containing protein [Sorangium]|uniref:STAS domain-containing protein n=1 Tax=Sorangium atrum TaxID=2995308 RepID=A0ABT5C5S6_9BACT|nr:STAS domain-containing protein [Sorangium aterium]MDC0681778.1 STAS domain-containing protein [Sorangium aterium]